VSGYSVVRNSSNHHHPNRYHFIGGSPDGITATNRLLEIKCPFSREVKHEVPTYYMAQLQTNMEIMDLDVADFVQWKQGQRLCEEDVLDILEVPRDRAWFKTVLPALNEFWHEVLALRALKKPDAEVLTSEPRKRRRPDEDDSVFRVCAWGGSL